MDNEQFDSLITDMACLDFLSAAQIKSLSIKQKRAYYDEFLQCMSEIEAKRT